MKRTIIAAIALVASLFAFAQPQRQTAPMPENVIFSARDTSPRTHEGRSSNNAPTFFIYPDAVLDSLGAATLVEELGVNELIPAFHANVMVINPVSEKYDAAADYKMFEELYNRSRSGNLKVIGIGNGATFVNQVVVPQAAGAIAGVLTIDGKATPAKDYNKDGVPAYVAGKNAKKVAAAYASMDAAPLKSSDKATSVYQNADEPLLKVVADLNAKYDLGKVFADAWETVLKKNFRYNNYKHTHYEGGKLLEFGPNELEPFTIWEDLNIVRNVVVQEQRNGKPWLWYEYWPEELMEGAPEKSVPVMVLLHGNGNDPRTQAETSGFIEVAGEDRFFVVEMEWQGSANFGAMGVDGIETVIYTLLNKYPQLDPSRIYSEGLSAGSMTSIQVGIKKSYLFAAVGGHSGGLFGASHNGPMGYFNATANEVAQKAGWVEMPYFLVTGTADSTIPFYTEENYKDNSILNAWNAYRKLNGLPEATELDFDKYPVFGFELSDRETIKTNKGEGITVETGVVYKGDIPLVKCGLVMDYGHWNFKPTARLLWDFFKHYSRDPETKKLIYTK